MKTDKFLLSTHSGEPATICLATSQKNTALWQSYQDKKSEIGMLFPTEGAKLLGVSEFELLLASPYSRYLGTSCREMLEALGELGRIENIVRNDFCVHEKAGNYHKLKLGEMMGLSLDDGEGALDLRIFLNHWQHMLAVVNLDGKHPSYSIQFFDGLGQAVNKVFLKDIEASLNAFNELCDKHADTTPSQIELTAILPQNDWIFNALSQDKLDGFQQAWLAMTDIHQFHGILTKYELDRPSSFVQAPKGYTQKLDPKIIEPLFTQLSENGLPVMIFVGNTGIVQIHSAPLYHIKRMGDWLNVLDDNKTDFSLHLKDGELAHIWLIRRPNGKDGDTLAIEAFDKQGNSILAMFGERVEGKTQDPAWQAFIQALAGEYAIENVA